MRCVGAYQFAISLIAFFAMLVSVVLLISATMWIEMAVFGLTFLTMLFIIMAMAFIQENREESKTPY